MTPTLSICIPTYNRSAYLRRCLVELQAVVDLPFDVEIVISDNASTDDTRDVVERALGEGLPVRHLVQQTNVGAERNVVSALRAARGTYAVYMGDDDRLIASRVHEIVRLFEQSPTLVCVQAPWVTRDDLTGRDVARFYDLDGPAAFTAADAWPCWQYLLHQRIFPEIAIYRTDALHAVLHLPRTMHWAFVWCFRLLGQGTVAFMPQPFYVHVVRPAADLPVRRQTGLDQSSTHLDRYRGGLEWGLAAGLRAVAGHVPLERRETAQRLLTTFIAERAAVAARVAAGDRDFIGATEHFTRSVAWDPGVDLPHIQGFEHQHAMLAAVQAVAETASSTAGVRTLHLCDIQGADDVQRVLADVFQWSSTVQTTLADPVPDDAMVLVATHEAREILVRRGALPGHILLWDEVANCFRVHNPLGAAVRLKQAAVA